MTKLCSTPAGAVLVAIDMSKSRQEVLLERPEGGRRRRMTVMATKEDYDGFAEQLAAIGRPIVVGFEATCNYHRTLAHRLLTAGFELRLISSVALARTREALHNSWDKNDSKDAQVILHMLRIGATQRYVVTPTRPDDNDRLRLPSNPPPQGSGAEKKESAGHRRNRACPRSDRPFSTSSHVHRRCDALTVKCRS